MSKRRALNLVQLKDSIENKLADYKEMLDGEIRIIGLREKVEKRVETLTALLIILNEHQE